MEPIIKVDNVSMCFNLSKEKHESLKEYFLALVQGRLQYDEFYALKDVSLDIMPGDFYGLVGLNGSGKSTLLKTIAGVYKPSKGKVTVNGTIAPLIELGAGFDMDLTARENIYLNGTVLGFSPKYLDEKFDEIVEFSELENFLDVPLKNYSSGMVARIGFAIATITKPDILIADEVFIEACREYFPDITKAFDDPRVNIIERDGLRFLRGKSGEYDLIINDSTDPFGHTEGLFTKEFYGSCYRALKDDGIMVYQHGSPFFDEDETAFRAMHRKAYSTFPVSRVYQAHIPTCPSGYWMFGFASKKYHPINDFNPAKWNARGIKTWYYTTNLHLGAFMLPKYVEDLLIEAEKNEVKAVFR